MKKTLTTFLALLGASALAVSAQTLNLWNINFAGNESDGFVDVSDGLTLQAGSFGGNEWNNVVAPVRDPYTPDSPLSMSDANGGSPIDFTWVESGTAGHHFTQTDIDAELFQGYFGVGDFDTTLQMSGLEAGTYDLYVYFTWGWNDDNLVDYSITAGSGPNLSETLDPNIATATYDDMEEGSNFVVFEGLSPDAGEIHLNALSDDGGFSAVQLVQVPEPSTYAAILGGLFLAFAIWRRRR